MFWIMALIYNATVKFEYSNVSKISMSNGCEKLTSLLVFKKKNPLARVKKTVKNIKKKP